MNVLLLFSGISLVTQLVATGLLFNLALISLLQYVAYLGRRYRLLEKERARLSAQAETHRDEVAGLASTLAEVSQDRTITRFENQTFRHFLAEPDPQRAMRQLLRQFAPHPAGDLAFYIQMSPQPAIAQAWGISEPVRGTITLDEQTLRSLRRGNPVVFAGRALSECALVGLLPAADRRKVNELFLIGAAVEGELIGVIATTNLFPPGTDRPLQLELAQRLMTGLTCTLKHHAAAQQRQRELETTNHRLELRDLADRSFVSPQRMLTEFLKLLRTKLDVDRAAVLLAPHAAGEAPLLFTCDSIPLPAGALEQWERYELLLAPPGLAATQLLDWDRETLARRGVRNLISRALLAPLRVEGDAIGVLCFGRQGTAAFTPEHQDLARWAAELLAGRIRSAISRALVEREARIDSLTQLANRRTFDSRIAEELETSGKAGEDCSLVMVDIDRFKSINDTYGHLGGDDVLRNVAHIIRDSVQRLRSTDRALCARYGGEEMAILLPGIGLHGAARVAEMIRAALESTPITWESHILFVTLSAGIACTPMHGATAADLIAAADAALYHAKTTGRNRVSLPATEISVGSTG